MGRVKKAKNKINLLDYNAYMSEKILEATSCYCAEHGIDLEALSLSLRVNIERGQVSIQSIDWNDFDGPF